MAGIGVDEHRALRVEDPQNDAHEAVRIQTLERVPVAEIEELPGIGLRTDQGTDRESRKCRVRHRGRTGSTNVPQHYAYPPVGEGQEVVEVTAYRSPSCGGDVVRDETDSRHRRG